MCDLYEGNTYATLLHHPFLFKGKPAHAQEVADAWEDGQIDPDDPVGNEDSKDSNYLPISEEDVSLGDEGFIVLEEPLEQERFKRRLIATMRSLKKK